MNKNCNTVINIDNNHNTLFANGYNYYKFFWIFVIGCVAGVLIETFWCFLITHHIESRTALVIGPFNPIYGFGAILMTLVYIFFKNKNNLVIFISTMLFCGLFETLCSIVQELVFGTISWYYDLDSLGILGKRTSIIYCIFWGILGIAWIKYIYPLLEKYIEKIQNKIGKILTFILTVFLIFDILLSSAAVYRQKERRNNIPANNIIREYLDNKYNNDVLKKIYPNMTIVK